MKNVGIRKVARSREIPLRATEAHSGLSLQDHRDDHGAAAQLPVDPGADHAAHHLLELVGGVIGAGHNGFFQSCGDLGLDLVKDGIVLGNTTGVAQVESDLAVTKEAAAAVFYTVKKGDTLWKIAEEHYGKGQGAKYTEIVKANTPPVKNPDLIQPGWVLRIPPKA